MYSIQYQNNAVSWLIGVAIAEFIGICWMIFRAIRVESAAGRRAQCTVGSVSTSELIESPLHPETTVRRPDAPSVRADLAPPMRANPKASADQLDLASGQDAGSTPRRAK